MPSSSESAEIPEHCSTLIVDLSVEIRSKVAVVRQKDYTHLLKNNAFKTDVNFSFFLLEILEAWSWQWDYCVTNGKLVEERVNME